MKYIGEKIREELEHQGRSVTWLAEQLGCPRMTVYRIFKNKSIDTRQLCNICEVLNYNFFRDLADDFDNGGKVTSEPV